MLAVAEAGRQRIDFDNTFRCRRHRFIEHGVAGGFNDFETGDSTILLDPNFYKGGNLSAGSNVRRRRDPRAVKTVIQQAHVPSELRMDAAADRPTSRARPNP